MIPDMNLKVSLMESDVSEVGGREAFCRKLSNYDICGGSHVLSQQPAGSAARLAQTDKNCVSNKYLL